MKNNKPSICIYCEGEHNNIAKSIVERLNESLISCYTTNEVSETQQIELNKSEKEIILNCKIMVLILSEVSINSKSLIRKIHFATDFGIKIILFKLDNFSISQGMEYYLSNSDLVDGFNCTFEDGTKKLYDIIKKNLSSNTKQTKHKTTHFTKILKLIILLIVILSVGILSTQLYFFLYKSKKNIKLDLNNLVTDMPNIQNSGLINAEYYILPNNNDIDLYKIEKREKIITCKNCFNNFNTVFCVYEEQNIVMIISGLKVYLYKLDTGILFENFTIDCKDGLYVSAANYYQYENMYYLDIFLSDEKNMFQQILKYDTENYTLINQFNKEFVYLVSYTKDLNYIIVLNINYQLELISNKSFDQTEITEQEALAKCDHNINEFFLYNSLFSSDQSYYFKINGQLTGSLTVTQCSDNSIKYCENLPGNISNIWAARKNELIIYNNYFQRINYITGEKYVIIDDEVLKNIPDAEDQNIMSSTYIPETEDIALVTKDIKNGKIHCMLINVYNKQVKVSSEIRNAENYFISYFNKNVVILKIDNGLSTIYYFNIDEIK